MMTVMILHTYAVSTVARFSSKPSKHHWTAVTHIMTYNTIFERYIKTWITLQQRWVALDNQMLIG